jgi:hypothetical protein
MENTEGRWAASMGHSAGECLDSPAQVLETEEVTPLRRLWVATVNAGGLVSANDFRADHGDSFNAIDRLIALRYIARESDQYRLTVLGLAAANDPERDQILQLGDRLYARLLAQYRNAAIRSVPVTLRDLTEELHLPVQRLRVYLYPLSDAIHLWCSQWTSNAAEPFDSLVPGEGVHRYKAIAGVRAQMEKWQRSELEQGLQWAGGAQVGTGTGNARTANSAAAPGPAIPATVTLPWLLNVVPISYWITAGGAFLTLLVAAAVFGIRVANTPPFPQIFGASPASAVPSAPGPRLSNEKNALGTYLAKADPDIFYGSKDGAYWIARVLPNQEAIYTQTRMAEDLGEVRTSFDILVNTGGDFVRRFRPAIEAALQRGVEFRFILSDYTETDPQIKQNFDSFTGAVGESPAEARGACENMRKELEELQKRIQADRGTYRGSLELRWNQRPLLYTLWVRDRNQTDAISHLSVHMYRGKSTWPAFRFGKDAKPMTDSLTAEFEHIWQLSAAKTAAESH